MVLIGDTAQLPRLADVSPALEADFLQVSYGMEIYEANLDRYHAAVGTIRNPVQCGYGK